MKNIYRILVGAAALLATVSCDDFFTREPIDKFSSQTYFSSETELKMYTDGMINSWMPSMDDIGYSGGSVYNDLIATRTSTDYYHPGIWNSTKQGSWSWSFARRVNYMLEHMTNAKGNVSESVYNHYEGVARFWRAYFYVSRINTFSDVPWLDKVLEPTDTTILFAARDDREYVFHNVVEDLKFACANCLGDSKYNTDGRVYINKWVALTYASRFFLYEGTFRKNHSVNPATNQPWNNQYETADDLIRLAAECAEEVIKDGGFSLSKNYADLFLSPTLKKEEVIWGRTYSEELGVRHNLTRYFNSSTLGQQYSGTKFLVRQYLKNDGTPVLTGEQTINEEFAGRDARLSATVLGPDHKILMLSGKTEQQKINFTWCQTGYMLVKWCIADEGNQQNSIDNNSLPILRYAEVLLNYAEAKKELGQMTEAIWNQTIGALRERAGVKNIYPLNAGYVEDQWLKEYYTASDLKYRPTLDNIDIEIRRERVTELALEQGMRASDLYRYNQADLIEKRYEHQGWPGLWITEEEAKNGFDFAGEHYTFPTSGNVKETQYPITTANNTNWTLAPAGKGYYLIYNYKLDWQDYMYARPIPVSATNLNPKLGQNYGWD